MFKRSFRSEEASSHRVDKTARLKKRDAQKVAKLQRSMTSESQSSAKKNLAPSPIVTLAVGPEGRLFAAHEDVLCQSLFFQQAMRTAFDNNDSKRISLPNEEPDAMSAVLEYLYKGDYYPRLIHNKRRNSWELEDSVSSTHNTPKPSSTPGIPGSSHASAVQPTVFMSSEGVHLLRDTVIYCVADRFGLEELKRLSLRKQGLQSGIDVATILRSATYAYSHTPDSDSRLRAHYLALIIRCRKTFKRSGTMQTEMERGGSQLFFDLFVAMCNHLDDVVDATNSRTPRTL